MGAGDSTNRLSHATRGHSTDCYPPGYSLRRHSAASAYNVAWIAAPWSSSDDISLSPYPASSSTVAVSAP